MRRAWWALLALGPVAFVGDHLGWPQSLVFVIAGLGTIPAAALLGQATEEIASGITLWDRRRRRAARDDVSSESLGAKVGGLLNATFGNIPEIIFGILALHQGYITLTKATIIGSVVGNAALVVGMALFFGGIRNGVQTFDADEASHHGILMVLTVASLALPSLFFATTQSHRTTEISVVAAFLLLLTYCAYLAYSMFGLRGGTQRSPDDTYIEEHVEIVEELTEEGPSWSVGTSVGVLALSTALVYACSEALIDTVASFTARFGWSPVFVGIIVVPILANVAEHSSAVILAFKNRTDMALGVASGSSIQVAVFVTPLLVFASQFGRHLNLVFSPIEITVLALVVAIFFFVSRGGKSNWLEGLQLMVLYVLAAVVFFFVPGQLR